MSTSALKPAPRNLFMDDEEIRQRLISAKIHYGSLRKLSPCVGISYKNLSRYLLLQRSPAGFCRNKLELFLSDIFPANHPYKRRFASKIDSIKLSPELAELVGIMFGDGEVKADGGMRLSFDPLKDSYFINNRAMPLILEQIAPNKITFESYNRISFPKASFVNWLVSAGFSTGSRPINDARIPEWCFLKEEYLTSFIRGLFDTDGTFTFIGHNAEIMLGRFSAKYTYFPKQLTDSLIALGIQAKLQQSKDGRYKIRITSRENILLFFALIGSSNPKHIVRFLLWRISNKPVRIDAQPIEELFSEVRRLCCLDFSALDAPFFWNSSNRLFYNWLAEDSEFLFASNLRESINCRALIELLLNHYPPNYIASILKLRRRSIKRWSAGSRKISVEHLVSVLDALFKKTSYDKLEELCYVR